MKRQPLYNLAQLAFKGMLLTVICFVPYLFLRHYKMQENDLDYSKFTHKAEHLILGVSRAKVGIVPEVLKEKLDLQGEVLNFAFTGLVAPYEENYAKLAMRKSRPGRNDKPSLFILSVNIGNLSWSDNRFDKKPPIYDLFLVNASPNPDYILRNINVQEPFLFNLLKSPHEEQFMFVVHRDGWAERIRESKIPDGDIYKKYKSSLSGRKLSAAHFKVLSGLTKYFGRYGDVVLVRMPVSDKMANLEDQIVPDFDEQLAKFAAVHGATYLNYARYGSAYVFSDPHHLLNTGARAFTHQLATDLQSMGIPGKKAE